jgi:Leucine-rich repeat (LRR) protein
MKVQSQHQSYRENSARNIKQSEMELFGTYTIDEKSQSYKFNVTRISAWKTEVLRSYVLRVEGEHIGDRTNECVESITFSNLELQRFPRHLNTFFPNLKTIVISSCGIKTLTKDDLPGLTNLKNLTLNGNEISLLSDDLFEEVPELEAVSFYSNKIEFVGSKIFDKLKKLTYANFKMNASIDACYKKTGCGVTLGELKGLIAIAQNVGKKTRLLTMDEVIQIFCNAQ